MLLAMYTCILTAIAGSKSNAIPLPIVREATPLIIDMQHRRQLRGTDMSLRYVCSMQELIKRYAGTCARSFSLTFE